MRALALTLDLDTPSEYAAIHGVRLAAEDPHLMYRRPLTRFAELCQRIGAPGTLFVISRDLCGPASNRLGELMAQGFEIASHSHNHAYDLIRGDAAALTKEVRRSREALRMELGIEVRGFRAPGYAVTSALLDVLQAESFVYDSSVMPSPPYVALKALVLTAYRLLGRACAAVPGAPEAALAPTQPYRPGELPYVPGARPILELPLAVATPARLPATGAAIILAPALLRRAMCADLQRRDILVFNLHAMDFVDAQADGLPRSLVLRQPELRIPVARRMEILAGFFGALVAQRELLTCAGVANRLQGRGAPRGHSLRVVRDEPRSS